MTPAPSAADRRLEVFCSAAGPEVFHSIVGHQEIWRPDPYDVPTIHEEARDTFRRLLDRAAAGPETGKVLLLQGVSGSGKTHLMRAFRNLVHEERGYCGYMQLSSAATNYARYALNNLIDSLNLPYRPPEIQTPALSRLSLGLLESVPGLTPEAREQFRDGDIPDLADTVNDYADRLLGTRCFDPDALDLLRALLYLQRDDPRVKGRVLKWLRCEELAPADRAVLGDIVPRTEGEAPLKMIERLGGLMMAVHGMPLVLCVDQLEDTYNKENAPEQFRRAVDTLVSLVDYLPSAVVVIACMEDYYMHQKGALPRAKIDRVERDPEPIRLTSQRTLEEVELLVARRLQALYDDEGAPFDEHVPTFPFTRAHLERLMNLRTRDVLDFCRVHRDRCIDAGSWVEPDGPMPEKVTPVSTELEQIWNDFLAAFSGPLPGDEGPMAELLHQAIEGCSDELPTGLWFAAEREGRMVPVEAHGPENRVDRLLVAVCDRKAQGGGLAKQVSEVEKRAGEVPAVLVRSTEFPASPKAAISKQVAEVIRRGGRRVVVENADWRRMAAFQEFSRQRGARPDFKDWRSTSCPLSQTPSLRKILNIDALVKQGPAPRAAAEQAKKAPAAAPEAPARAGPLLLGTKAGLTGGAVTVDPQELLQHAAFLGGSGSGKTTAALNLIEQLLERGTPAVLLDRKGDLCRYADPQAWATEGPDAARRERLRQRLDVAVFTPGAPDGRPLTLPVVPDGLDTVPTLEREQIAGYAAAALGGMMGYKPRGTDAQCQAILRKAIEVLAASPGGAVSVPNLRALIEERDDTLLNAVGGYDDRQYKKLGNDLLTLWLHHKHLLEGGTESLDIDVLLGRGGAAPAGKARLSVISTRFLRDQATTDFWVAQLLVALGRWIGKSPSTSFQAVFLFDEADLYLPALRQPATKTPMENLLKRARSGGVGLLLASQSPGDFDYKCRDNIRTWLVGRVKETTALTKLKPMFAESKLDVAAKLPAQGTGEFYLMREREVLGLRTAPSLIRTEQLPEDRILELARGAVAVETR
jgi:energy-coupling factor transporter ATP-binding protein EcfA2